MNRRQLARLSVWPAVALLSNSCWPLASLTARRTPRLGWPDFVAREVQEPPRLRWFLEGLSEYGWVEDQKIAVEYESSDEHDEHLSRFSSRAGEPAGRLAIRSTRAALAAWQATSTIPIVFASLVNPVQSRVVESLACPGANVTDMAQLSPEMAGMRLNLVQVCWLVGRRWLTGTT